MNKTYKRIEGVTFQGLQQDLLEGLQAYGAADVVNFTAHALDRFATKPTTLDEATANLYVELSGKLEAAAREFTEALARLDQR